MSVDENRRNFLKGMIALGALVVIGGLAKPILDYATVSGEIVTTFPKIKVTNISQLQVNQPFIFNYPLTNEPNYLVMLSQPAKYGIGPQNNIVAFSAICEHLVAYTISGPPLLHMGAQTFPEDTAHATAAFTITLMTQRS